MEGFPMRLSFRGLASAAMVMVVAALASPRVEAGYMTYTLSFEAGGALGTHGFDSVLTLSVTADTSLITHNPGANDTYYSAYVSNATVTVDGITATFSQPVFVDAVSNDVADFAS